MHTCRLMRLRAISGCYSAFPLDRLQQALRLSEEDTRQLLLQVRPVAVAASGTADLTAFSSPTGAVTAVQLLSIAISKAAAGAGAAAAAASAATAEQLACILLCLLLLHITGPPIGAQGSGHPWGVYTLRRSFSKGSFPPSLMMKPRCCG